ncbi:hypothetical protein [Algoriphagus sp. AK58]|uniref:hypothetical protein n=1 Tax=Algoriphagus sp. AK58 TaxID=1406877 RepID=UPI00164EFBF9|nr:hypothetical protein [Algoriphagus sp. AK58]MBC6365989.1 hypothetical protein [Algoriphagus sp. AK58]
MKKLLLVFIAAFFFLSCSEQEEGKYTGNQLEFQLYQSSTYNFNGNLTARELVNGSLEFTLRLDGSKTNTDYSYPAHLHFGSYDQKDSPIAFLLNPVSARNLESVTVLGTLSDGSKLNFESMKSFDGHVKIHLANEGPDYGVILVSGNVGPKSAAKFELENLAICGNEF